jgi:hypothetical protein
MVSAILWALAATLVGTLGLIFTWLQLRHHPVRGEGPPRQSETARQDETPQPVGVDTAPAPLTRLTRSRPPIVVAVSLALLVLGFLIAGSLSLFTSSPSGPRPRATVTVTITATPPDIKGKSSSDEGDGNDAAMIAAIGAVIAGLGTAASGAAAMVALFRRKEGA